MHFRALKFKNFPGGACPQTPLDWAATQLIAFSNFMCISYALLALPPFRCFLRAWESIQIILNTIKQQNNPTHPPICILTQLFNFVLNYNCFNFANLFFLQVNGIAMGTKLAPNYTNLFMANFETKHFSTKFNNLYFIGDTLMTFSLYGTILPRILIVYLSSQFGSSHH